MMTNHPTQLNLDILPPVKPQIGEICAQLDVKTQQLIASPNEWPNPILCLRQYWGDGGEKIFEKWNDAGNQKFIINDNNIDEYGLFAKFTMAERGEINLLILSFVDKEKMEIKSPDLKSRLDNVTYIETIRPSKANLAKVLEIALKKSGINIGKKHQEKIINELNLDFVIISQLISYILEKYPMGFQSKSDKIEELILNFENKMMGNGLFERD